MEIVDKVIKWGYGELASLLFQDTADELKKCVKEYVQKEPNSIKGRYYNLMVEVIKEMLGKKYSTDIERVYEIAESIRKNTKCEFGEYNEYIQSIQKGLKECRQENLSAEIFAEKLDDKISEDQKLCNNILINMSKNIEWSDVRNRKNFEILMKQLKKDNVLDENKLLKKNNSRNKQYADVWNKNMFLNDYNKRDENRGINIKLKEMYTDEFLPHYIWKNNFDISCDLKNLLNEYIFESNDNKMLLVMGQPGVGKSTLITWILNKYYNCIDDIYVYSFASDLEKIDWCKKNQILEETVINNILKELNLTYEELNGKTLILDGFDEINVNENRIEILDYIYRGLKKIKNLCRFSLIMTCRENYIENDKNMLCDYIKLQPFDKSQIKLFCKKYVKKNRSYISDNTIKNIVAKKDIFGIPLILYMILALNISVDSEGTIVDVYDKIFSLDNGGIYDRCIDKKSFGDRHRISKIKEKIHNISRDIAIWMFENEPEKATISKKEFDIICNDKINDNDYDKQDVSIGNYFKLVRHTDGTETQEICFIHRSVYEYFVVETIYTSIEQYMYELTEENQEKIAGTIGYLLKQGELTLTMEDYLQYKFKKFIEFYYNKKIEKFYKWCEGIFVKMLDKGMLYYSKKNICHYSNIMYKEMICFVNMTIIIRIIFKECRLQGKDNSFNIEYILEDEPKEPFIRYLYYYSALQRMGILGGFGLAYFI